MSELPPDARPRPRGPDHYSGIKAHPLSLRGWAFGVFAAGLLQSGIVALVSNVGGVFLLLMLPMLVMINPIFLTYLGVLIGFVIGAAVAGHMFPHCAFYRGGASFLFIALYDFAQVNWYQAPGLFVEETYEIAQLVPFALLGALVCAFAGSLGSRWNRGIGEWLAEELDEFYESLGLSAPDEEEDMSDSTSTDPETR